MNRTLISPIIFVGFVIFASASFAQSTVIYKGVPINTASAATRQTDEVYQIIGTSVSQLYLQAEMTSATSRGKSFSNLEQYTKTQWELHQSGLQELEQQLLAYKNILISYTAEAKTGTTAQAFYEQLPAETRARLGLETVDVWQHYLRVMPTPAHVDQQLATFPKDAQAGYEAYGKSLDFASFKEQWTLRELSRVHPPLIDRLSTRSLIDAMTTATNPRSLSLEKAESQVALARSQVLDELATRLVVAKEAANVQFEDPDGRTCFFDYWQTRINAPIGRSVIPQGALRRIWTHP